MKQQVCLIVMVACGLALVPAASGQQFGPWSERFHLTQPPNSEYTESQAFITKDGLSLYFTRLDCSDCSSGVPQDIWVSHRDTVESIWSDPVRLPETVNSTSPEGTPFVTIDGHFLFFASQRPGGVGKNDIYISRRKNKGADDGWGPAVDLGPAINSKSGDRAPYLFEDENSGKTTLYFTSNRSGNDDIYASELQADGSWGPATPVTELNSAASESQATLSRNGLEIYFVSNREGSMLSYDGLQVSDDIWMAQRARSSEPWSVPQPVAALNTPNWEGRPTLSWDGQTIYFNTVQTPQECEERGQCNVSSAWDIWTAHREKLTGPQP